MNNLKCASDIVFNTIVNTAQELDALEVNYKEQTQEYTIVEFVTHNLDYRKSVHYIFNKEGHQDLMVAISNKHGFEFISNQPIPIDMKRFLETKKFEEWFNNLSYYYFIFTDHFNDYVIDFYHIEDNLYEIKYFKCEKQSDIRSN